ncbi:MAG TPA: hypothetical protein VG759_19565, partial [Candidatus Angelobacter sp.]|nr:hypothetical protein [Candidatus Angelobacter sp.]
MLRLPGPSGRNNTWPGAALLLFACLLTAAPAAAQSCSVDVSTNPFSPAAGQAMTVNATLNSNGGPILTARAIGGGGSADVSYDGATICSSFSDSCSTTIDPGSPGLHNLSWSCSDSNGSNSGSQTVDVTSPSPTPTPTPTPTPGGTNGGIGPKFVVLAVTYAPPGPQSTVTYM